MGCFGMTNTGKQPMVYSPNSTTAIVIFQLAGGLLFLHSKLLIWLFSWSHF